MNVYAPIHFYALRKDFLSALLCQFFEENDRTSSCSVQELIELGGVYVNSQRATCDQKIPEGSLVKAFPFPKRYPLEALPFLPEVVFENEDFVVINKPAPFPTHAVASNAKENLIHFMEEREQRKFHVTSRLDVDTKGLILLAKSPDAQAKINALFYKGQVEKIYQALTETPPSVGLITHFQSTVSGTKKVFRLQRESVSDKECRLVVTSVDKVDKGYLCTLKLLSGRTHQIRGQLALLGCPIDGDSLYGTAAPAASPSGADLQLQCSQLAFRWNGQLLHFVRKASLVDLSTPAPE